MEAYFDNLHLLILRIIQELYRITSGRVIEESLADRIFSTLKIGATYWSHFIENTDQYLKSLLYSNVLCSSSKYNNCSGKVEIKYYMVPGYNMTGPATHNGTSTGNIYPGYTRVNHGKYAVSDVRAHIGTSNLSKNLVKLRLIQAGEWHDLGERNFNRFGGWLGKNSTTGENVRLLEDLHVHLLASRESSSGKGTIRPEYLTPILKQLTNPLRLLPKDEAVKKVVEFMNVYSINPEDFDTIVELSKFQAPKKQIAAILEPSDDKIGEENGDVLAGSDEENSSDTEDQGDDATKSKKLQTELQSLNSKGVQVQLELKETKNSSTKKKQAGRGKGGSAASASSEKKAAAVLPSVLQFSLSDDTLAATKFVSWSIDGGKVEISSQTVGKIAGWDLKDRSEANLIEDIVGNISRRLINPLPSVVGEQLVGIESRVEEIYKLLEFELDDRVTLVGICGMGGIASASFKDLT
ncbi:hypothetical protein QYF36_008127 [Acer negundo]|nr:hypothetical protein QYF36_008127 [Acer negundo]